MTTMPAPAGPSTEKLIALVTNGCQFAGPAALLGMDRFGVNLETTFEARAVTEDQITTMLTANPRHFFENKD